MIGSEREGESEREREREREREIGGEWREREVGHSANERRTNIFSLALHRRCQKRNGEYDESEREKEKYGREREREGLSVDRARCLPRMGLYCRPSN